MTARNGVVMALLLALAFLAYFPALSNAFYNDDAIFLNHARRILEHPTALVTEHPLGYFRPVYSAYITLIYLVGRTSPVGYYLAGIVLHAATGFLVYRLGRKLLNDSFAAFAAGALFTIFFSHSEATVWIAAHNSTLVCFLALAATLAHIRACEKDTVASAIVTGVLVALTLLTKEPGIVALAWVPLAEWRLFGFKHCFSKQSLLRYALVAVAAAIYLHENPRLLGNAFAENSGKVELRSTFGFVTPARVLGATFWLFSWLRSGHESLAPSLGVAVLAIPLVACFLLSQKRVPDALFAIGFLIAAIVPACSTTFQQMNGSRLYYFPTAGAALLVAALIAAMQDRLRDASQRTKFASVLVGLFALYAGVNIRAIHVVNDSDYLPISRLQTNLAKQIGPLVAQAGKKPVYVLEPWLDNIMHAQQFLELFASLDPNRVKRIVIPRANTGWLSRQRESGASLVLDADDQGNLAPAMAFPSTRNSAQNLPRSSDTGVFADDVRMLAIFP